MLAPFSIIVAIDSAGGIAKGDEIPWGSKEDARFFRDTTIGKKKNVVIMGRTTYESIPEESRPLSGRKCVVISRTWKQDAHPEISVYASLTDALAGVGNFINSYDEVFVAGGEQLYKEAVRDFGYLCNKVYVTKFKSDYSCDLFFPYDLVKDFPLASDPVKTRDYVRYVYKPNEVHDEYQYLDLLKDIKEFGESKPDSATGTKMIFGRRLCFDIRDRLPLITTKRMNYEEVTKDLIFMIEGLTDARRLEEQNVKIYNQYTNKKSLENTGLSWDEGDTGPNNGWCFRHWGEKYVGCDENYGSKGYDQLVNLVSNIRTNPFGIKHILTSTSPLYSSQLSVRQNISMIQFNVSFDRKNLDCQIYQQDGDLFADFPHQLAMYSLLTLAIAHVTQLRPRNLIYIIGEAHVSNNLISQINKQMKRTPRPFPKVSFREATRIHEITDFNVNSFIIEGYNPWPAINGD